jgi:DNA repair protein SbcC/Rad50
MRIERLSITGFGPFRETQVIDFAKYNNDLFLITGKTGAGKSSILDAICFAYFGDIPRYEQSVSGLRSDYCGPDEPTEVVLEFSLGTERYRIRRVPEYERSSLRKSGGTTKQTHQATLERLDGDKYIAVTAKVTETEAEIRRLLRLNKEQFLQVILLAQGRFQDFLKSSSEERLPVLRSLFGTVRFERLEKKLDEERKVLEVEVGAVRQAVSRNRDHALGILDEEEGPEFPDQEWYESRLTELKSRLNKAKTAAAKADTARTIANAEADRLREIATRQQQRADAVAALELLAEKEESIAADRLTIAADDRSAPVIPQVGQDREAAETVKAAEAELAKAASDGHLGTPTPTTAKEAQNFEAEADKLLGALEGALEDEKAAETLAAQLRAADMAATEADKALNEMRERAARIPELIAETNSEIVALSATAALKPAATASVERIEAALANAKKLVKLAAELQTRSNAVLLASRQDAEASANHNDLLHRQLAGYAGVIATSLADGDPCPVCGSTAHPHLAEVDESTVTQDDVDDAKALADDRRQELTDATSRKAETEADLAAVAAAAGGRSAEELTVDLAAAQSELKAAVTAETALATTRATLASLEAESTKTTAEITELSAASGKARSTQAALVSKVKDMEERLIEARAEYPSVSERVSSLAARRAALAAFRVQSETLAQARASKKKTAKVLAELLTEHGFASLDEAESAHLSPSDRTSAQERVRKYQADIDGAKGVLATVVDTPTETVDLADATAKVVAASTLRDETRDHHVLLAEAHQDFSDLKSVASEDTAKLATITEAYELVRQLASAVAGKTPNTKLIKLETFVLAAELEDIVTAANERLSVMTSGRYVLQHVDHAEYRNTRGGLGLEVLDQYSGRARATHSLSGGETFLASLALALGLAEVVSSRSGAVKLDTLFIDEGFGSLDSDTLELAMTTLDSLRAGGRTIGIISHVESMKEQVHAQLRVQVGAGGSSSVAS